MQAKQQMCRVHCVAANYVDEAVLKLKVEADNSARACQAWQHIVKDINDTNASGDHVDLHHVPSPNNGKQRQVCSCCQCRYRLCV